MHSQEPLPPPDRLEGQTHQQPPLEIVDTILCGDAFLLLKQLPANSVDLVITSPPYYQQRDYNSSGLGVGHEKTIDYYIDSLVDVFSEVVRVVKDTGNIVYNIGDKYIDSSLLLAPYRFAIRVTEEYNIRLVNDITWVKKNPTPRQFDRRLVSSTEPFFHFAKSPRYYYSRDEFFEKPNTNQHHKPTGKLGNRYRHLIDQSDLPKELKAKAHNALDVVVKEVLDGKLQGFRMKIRGIHAEAFGGQEGGRKGQLLKNGFTIIRIHGKSMKKDAITHTVEAVPGLKHTAVFPMNIIREFVKMLTPQNGVVLDPYVGSGTTALASMAENRHYIGIDIDPMYCELSEERIARWQPEKVKV